MSTRWSRSSLSFVIALAIATISVASADDSGTPPIASSRASSDEAFRSGLPKQAGPVVVRARFHLRDINDIDDEAETFEFRGVLTLEWHDERQAFDPAEAGVDEKVYLGAYQFAEVFVGWFPQVVLVNQSGLYETEGVVLRVQSNGDLTLIQTVDAVGEADLSLRRYPFDEQRLEAVFEVLGFDADEVVLQAADEMGSKSDESIEMPQWILRDIAASTRERKAPYAGREGVASRLVLSMHVERESMFMLRLVVLPLVLIVMLSWSVFWMDRSSLGDRISVSFIGLLTAVAYQTVVSETLPNISYLTLMTAFLNLSFMIMCATVIINLRVGALDQRGEAAAGDRLDRRSRWAFPLTYLGLIGIATGVTFAFF